jgi:hypothetical protein
MKYLNETISASYGQQKVPNDIGIEIELEYTEVDPKVYNSNVWTTVADGSLRNGLEYRLTQPVDASKLNGTIDELCSALPLDKIRLSTRTSVHVHVNMTNYTWRQLLNIYSGYLIYENLLCATQLGRVANHFCLRTIDSEDIYNRVINGVQSNSLPDQFGRDAAKYSGLNFCTLPRIGTLEFRFLNGYKDSGPLKMWCNGIYHMTKRFADIPIQDQLDLAHMGSGELTRRVITPELAPLLRDALPQLTEEEKLSGLKYATQLKIILEAAPPAIQAPPVYQFHSQSEPSVFEIEEMIARNPHRGNRTIHDLYDMLHQGGRGHGTFRQWLVNLFNITEELSPQELAEDDNENMVGIIRQAYYDNDPSQLFDYTDPFNPEDDEEVDE